MNDDQYMYCVLRMDFVELTKNCVETGFVGTTYIISLEQFSFHVILWFSG